MVRFASGAFACLLAFNSTARAVDLFDFLPLDAFWKSQGVTVSKESMTDLLTDTPTKDVAGLIEQLGSERFVDREKAYTALKNAGGAILPQLEKAAEASDDVEIRQRLGQLIAAISVRAANRATLQMAAMTTVQANKMMGVLPAVRKLTASDNPLVASYAAETIAKLEGRPYKRPEPTDQMLDADLSLLPYDCGMVAQVRGSNAVTGDFYALLAGLPFGGAREVEQIQRELVKIVPRLGNVRADSMTIGVSDDFGPRGGYVIFVFRGHGSKKAFESLFREESRNREPLKVHGSTVWRPDPDVAVILPSDERMILLVSEREKYLPIRRVALALKNTPEKLQVNPTMRELIAKVDRTKAAWGVAKITSVFRGELPPLDPFDWFVGEIDQQADGTLAATFTGYGPDAKSVATAVTMTKLQLLALTEPLKGFVERAPAAKPILETAKSIQLTNDGNHAKVAVTAKDASAVVFSPIIISYAHRMQRSAEREAIGRPRIIDDKPVRVRDAEPAARVAAEEARRTAIEAAARRAVEREERLERDRALPKLRKEEKKIETLER